MRTGREPAEDVKRRVIAACQEVGLTVVTARMQLVKEEGARLVMVEAGLPGWAPAAMLEILVVVPVTGEWPEHVDIRCCASQGNSASLDEPWLHGRGRVPFLELIEHLRATIEERAQVVTAVKAGIPGPYQFEKSVWRPIELL